MMAFDVQTVSRSLVGNMTSKTDPIEQTKKTA